MITLSQTIKYIIDNNLYHSTNADTQTAVEFTIQDAEIDLGTAKHVLTGLPTNHNYSISVIDSMFIHMHDSNQLIEEAIANHINRIKLEKIL